MTFKISGIKEAITTYSRVITCYVQIICFEQCSASKCAS